MKRVSAIALTIGSCLPYAALAADLPKISVMTADAKAAEAGSDPASFVIIREGASIDKPLTVFFTMSGTATNGVDYASVGPSITFPAQSPMATVTIKPIADALVEGTETVVLTLSAKPGVYTLGEDKSGEATITDAPRGSAGAPTGNHPNDTTEPPVVDTTNGLPRPDRTGTLLVTMTFDAAGNWNDPRSGAYSNMKFHRVLTYTIPLRGTYGPGSGFTNIDKRDVAGPVFMPNFKRFLVLEPRDLMAPLPRVCGKGTAQIADERSGMEVGDPGQPPLVPFTETIKGGGVFPSGDKTVPERDLCLTKVTLDFEKHVFHMSLDGSDSNVKVINVHNGHAARPMNLPLQGYDSNGAAKAKLTWFDMPMGAGNPNTIAATRTFEAFNTVSGPMQGATFPLTARIEYRLTLNPAEAPAARTTAR
jgi:hypothetical protein